MDPATSDVVGAAGQNMPHQLRRAWLDRFWPLAVGTGRGPYGSVALLPSGFTNGQNRSAPKGA